MNENTNTNTETNNRDYYNDYHAEGFFTDEFTSGEFGEIFPPAGKKTGIIISIIMIALGLLAAFVSLPFGIGLGFIATAGLGIYGIAQIITYFHTPPAHRNGWKLANGVLLLLFSLFILLGSFGNIYGSFQLISVITFSIGFFTLSNGIDQLNTFFVLRKKKIDGSGWLLAGGIINLMLSIFMIINPVLSWFSLSVIWGGYLIISGIAFLAETLSGRSSVHITVY